MPPAPIKAIFIRSRRQLLDNAILHLSEVYYPRLSDNKDKRCASKKYIDTRKGEFFEGAIAFPQNDRKVLISITAFDVATLEKKLKWMNPSQLELQQPEGLFLSLQTLIVSGLIFILFASFNLINATIGALLALIIYPTFFLIIADEYGRKFRQSPSPSLLMLLPDCTNPANENWLIVGDEIFLHKYRIEQMALINACRGKGIGLLVFTQSDKMSVCLKPQHNRQTFERKFEVPLLDMVKT